MNDAQWFDILVQIAAIVAAMFGGGALVPVVAWLKRISGASGFASIVLVATASLIMGTAELLVAGQIVPDQIAADNFGAVVIAIFAASQAVYRMLKDKA